MDSKISGRFVFDKWGISNEWVNYQLVNNYIGTIVLLLGKLKLETYICTVYKNKIHMAQVFKGRNEDDKGARRNHRESVL